MIIHLPYKVDMSVNMQYRHTRQGKFLTKKALMLRAKIIKDVKKNFNNLPVDETLRVKIWLTENWICKNGEIRKADLDNRLKFLIDSVFKGIEMDDKYVFEIQAKKEQSEEEEFTVIEIMPRHDKDIW